MESQIEQNWLQFKSLLEATGREGTQELLAYLETTDFKIAPASGKFHLSVEGGLVEHSLNVHNFALDIDSMLRAEIDKNSLVISALLHDLCKANYYAVKEKWDGAHKEATGQWRKMNYFGVEDKFPMGHGEKSVIVAMEHIKLTDEEKIAIRWHMGFSDPATHFGYPSGIPFKEATAMYPLAKIIAMADQMAECYEILPKKEEKNEVGTIDPSIPF